MFTSKINPTAKHQILRGPRGLLLELDASEIFPDDPGMGTPLLVRYKRETMTLECAMNNVGEILDNGSAEDYMWAYDWLSGIYEEAEKWLDYHYEAKK